MSQGNNPSSNLTEREENLEPELPNDLMFDIFSRLPGKSIARFHCLSKLWCSMLHRPYFKELFLKRSSSRPRLLFIVEEAHDVWCIYSSPQPQNPDVSSLVVTADFHMKFHGSLEHKICRYTSGLVFFQILKENGNLLHMICNPITGHYATLPHPIRLRQGILGFDPIDKTFKVLAEEEDYDTYPSLSVSHAILTLESGNMSWRSKLGCPLDRDYLPEGICINGVCYNLRQWGYEPSNVIACFDVRTEKFKFIDAECFCDKYEVTLINYKGRLGGIYWNDTRTTFELCMCVLEDEEKQEWSKRVYIFGNRVVDPLNCRRRVYFGENTEVDLNNSIIVGVTATGEVVLSMKYTYNNKLYVYYFNPERNTLQSVEIKGFEKHCRVKYAFVDYVEDLNVNDTKQLKARWPLRQGLKIIRRSSIPQKKPVKNSAPPVKNNQPTMRNKYELLDDLE